MLEITPDDIALLSDRDLRAVVARLCEAELRRQGFSASHVTWGGDQNATDGGIDVRVALPPGSVIQGFVPRAASGFQVKKQDMPPAEIVAEMCPKGAIRASIRNLVQDSGAYVLVSSEGSTSDSALKNRRDAMKQAIAELPNAGMLALDFYDRTRVATWLRSHEGLIPWVRGLIGKAIPGWQSYGPWAYAPAGLTAEYLLDDKLRIHPAKKESEAGLPALHGIQQIRDQLRHARHVVRLVGLSGVGKTRLVQALFDERVGQNSLDPSLAIYTNMADGPEPAPIGLVSNLVATGTRAIVVIDNCPSDLHHRLSELCRQQESRVSVITVEYDIREDEPEGTEVFTLEASSPDLIERLLKQRHADISQIDARTIAEFSGGNARIAIALAATIEHNETVAGLSDEQLFQRLFLQRHNPDESLYLAAQACSLVYSFQGENVSEDSGAELIALGKLIGQSPQELYRNVARLRRRDLVQARSVWRAVLPHAVANRLAATALQNTPYAEIEKQLITEPRSRLMKSFSRRLGYLHASKDAIDIVEKWLGVGGLLEDVANLNDLGRAMFTNIAPVAPGAALAGIERACLGPNGVEAAKACKEHVDLLRSIAYDPELFERCVASMVGILIAGDFGERAHETQLFASLFLLCLSGTHAPIEKRLKVIEALLASQDAKRRALGILALEAALEAWHFHAGSNFEFGARSRDYGYWPGTLEEVQHWFRLTINLVESFACGNGPMARQVRTALAENFRAIWHRAGIRDELARTCRAIKSDQFWPEGWLSVRQTLDLDGKGAKSQDLSELIALEAELRPTSLLEKVRSVVFSTRLQGIDLDEDEDHSDESIGARMARTEVLAKTLGEAVALTEVVLQELIPEVVSQDGRLWSFGQGLAKGASNPSQLWTRLIEAVEATEVPQQKPQVLMGFLAELNATNPDLVSTLLDDAVEHGTLSRWYPCLQVAIKIESRDVARLQRSLAVRKAPARIYTYLAYGRATDPIPAKEMKELVLTIAGLPDGDDVAVEILHMRLHSDEEREGGVAPELIDAGCDLIQQLAFTKRNDREDYRLGAIAKSCLNGPRGIVVTKELCRKLKAAVAKHETSAFYHDDLLLELFRAQPSAALDGLCGGDEEELDRGVRMLRDAGGRKHILDAVPDDDLVLWCDKEPQSRYIAFAHVVTISHRTGETGPPRWSSIALRFLERAPEPSEILKAFVGQFMPMGGWGGSLAAILEANGLLLDQLEGYPALRTAVAQQKNALRDWVLTEKRREAALDRQRDERFE